MKHRLGPLVPDKLQVLSKSEAAAPDVETSMRRPLSRWCIARGTLQRKS
jgi:hypothetical protein